jgi:CheY-like chemotaxis protein
MDRMLTELGFDVVTAASGHEAIELLKTDNSIGAVLTDLLMPGMDGIELFKASRNINYSTGTEEIPPPEFIMMTALRPSANVDQKDASPMRQAVSLGFVDAMLKPIDKDRLLRNLILIKSRLPGESTDTAEPADAGVGTNNAVSAPPVSRDNWQTAVAEVRTSTQSQFEELQSEHSELKEKLRDVQTLVEELRRSS